MVLWFPRSWWCEKESQLKKNSHEDEMISGCSIFFTFWFVLFFTFWFCFDCFDMCAFVPNCLFCTLEILADSNNLVIIDR